MKSLDEQLRAAYQAALEKGYSLRQIAEHAGVARQSLCSWVNRNRGLTLASAEVLAAWFGMKLTRHKIPRKDERV